MKKVFLWLFFGVVSVYCGPPSSSPPAATSDSFGAGNFPGFLMFDPAKYDANKTAIVSQVGVQFMTMGTVAVLMKKYWDDNELALDRLERHLQVDQEVRSFLLEVIDSLRKGRYLVGLVAGIGVVSSLLAYPFTKAVSGYFAKNVINNAPAILKSVIALYYLRSIELDMKRIESSIKEFDEDVECIQSVYFALKTLRWGRALAMTIAATNGFDIFASVTSPLWIK